MTPVEWNLEDCFLQSCDFSGTSCTKLILRRFSERQRCLMVPNGLLPVAVIGVNHPSCNTCKNSTRCQGIDTTKCSTNLVFSAEATLATLIASYASVALNWVEPTREFDLAFAFPIAPCALGVCKATITVALTATASAAAPTSTAFAKKRRFFWRIKLAVVLVLVTPFINSVNDVIPVVIPGSIWVLQLSESLCVHVRMCMRGCLLICSLLLRSLQARRQWFSLDARSNPITHVAKTQTQDSASIISLCHTQVPCGSWSGKK